MLSPEILFWVGLAVKMALTATAVVAVSVAVERSGAFVGALISALPTSVGAAYVILALEQPPDSSPQAPSAGRDNCGSERLRPDLYDAGAALRPDRQPWRGDGRVVCARVRLSLIPLDAVRRRRGVRRDLRGHHPAELALSHRERTDKIRAQPLRYSAARACRRRRRGRGDDRESSIGPFASGMLALFPIILGSSIAIMHPRIGGKATASMVAHAQVFLIGIALGVSGAALSGRADRGVAGALGRALHLPGLERRPLCCSAQRAVKPLTTAVFASRSLSAYSASSASRGDISSGWSAASASTSAVSAESAGVAVAAGAASPRTAANRRSACAPVTCGPRPRAAPARSWRARSRSAAGRRAWRPECRRNDRPRRARLRAGTQRRRAIPSPAWWRCAAGQAWRRAPSSRGNEWRTTRGSGCSRADARWSPRRWRDRRRSPCRGRFRPG